MAARRAAAEWGDSLGGIVGYQVRFEHFSSARTRLWYLTEGVLTRKLLANPGLNEVRLVVLDEFHERHLETDLALALLRRLQARNRPDLRLLLMSATLARDEIAAKLGHPPVIRAPGRVFPVRTRYTPHSADPLETQVFSALNIASQQTAGHILVFLPGAGEIRKCMQSAEPIRRQSGARLLALYGDLTSEEQDLAVNPSDVRKIIFSTNVAESSITIDGIEAVIDSGLARVLTHSPWSGLSRLRVEKISQSSAIQRAGRAGRTGPGIAIRLFSESDFVRRPSHIAPEIMRADLTQLLLDLAAAGLSPDQLAWLDPPPAETVQHARDLLVRLRGLNAKGSITEAGRQMAGLPIHPRLACFVFEAARIGARREACQLAAQLSESRLRFEERAHAAKDSDLDLILSADLSPAARRSMQQLLDFTQSLRAASRDPQALERALLCAYPDRVAVRRGEKLLLANATSARLDRSSAAHGDFLVAIEVDDRSSDAAPLVRFAAGIEPDWLLEMFPDRVETLEELAWNREEERVEQVNSLRYDGLVIDESRSAPSDPSAAANLLASQALIAGIHRFADAQELERFFLRLKFATAHSNELQLPDALLADAFRQLAQGLTSFNALRDAARKGGLLAVIEASLPMRLVNEIAPLYITLPSGRRAKIEYHEGRPPSVASRLQDFFGMKESPSVARGAVPLVVELLAPNHRPVQVTTDLVSFWKNLYPQVRRELSRRYPKHAWPEIPA
jgi:ATP-dependent helicase HrpB